MLTLRQRSGTHDDPAPPPGLELHACLFTIDYSQDLPTRVQPLALVGVIVWTVDPRIWDDKKFLSLNGTARLAWLCILTGAGRTALPGLTTNFDALTLASSLRYEVTECTFAIRDILDRDMAQYDPDVRVLRVPNAPKYSICRNPNILAGWFRLWSYVPDCALKFGHIGNISEAVNFENESMVARWDRTFGRVQKLLEANPGGVLLPSVSLRQRLTSTDPIPSTALQAPAPAALAAPPPRTPTPAPKRFTAPRQSAKDPNSDRPLPVSCFSQATRKRTF